MTDSLTTKFLNADGTPISAEKLADIRHYIHECKRKYGSTAASLGFEGYESEDEEEEEEDIVFHCCDCMKPIVRDSEDHDNCICCDEEEDDWLCVDCKVKKPYEDDE